MFESETFILREKHFYFTQISSNTLKGIKSQKKILKLIQIIISRSQFYKTKNDYKL